MAKLLTQGGEEICVLSGFQTAGAIGPMGTSFSASATFDEAMSIGHRNGTFLIEHNGARYNAAVQQTNSVAMDGMASGTLRGTVWTL